MRRRRHWGWGWEDEPVAPTGLAELVGTHLGFELGEPEEPVPLAAAHLPDPPIDTPFGSDARERATHTYGQGYRDLVRGFRGDFSSAPAAVARPADEDELEQVLEWAGAAGVPVVPYGGGTSVVGGVELAGAVSLDLSALNRVLEVDPVSRAAHIQAGATGPGLEEQLGAHGLTMRFYPQSFELSTLGGWIATRAGGHFATLWTHVDDLVESVRALTPAHGWWESRRLPGSGAGVSPDRMLLGSEGALAVLTSAWVRVRPRPVHRAGASVAFHSFAAGAAAVRALSQSDLHPANCRLIEAREAGVTGAGDGAHDLLVVGFESADHPVDGAAARARAICEEHGGTWEERGAGTGSWREAFLRAPYLRDSFVALGVFAETFETAITWDRFDAFHHHVRGAVEEALGGEGFVTCRFTHVYPDGPAPYFTVLAPARRGDELAQWEEVKTAASQAVIDAGGTITHHHAVGRDHRPWYDQQRPDPFAAAFRAAKAELDPHGLLNPGVLLNGVRPRVVRAR